MLIKKVPGGALTEREISVKNTSGVLSAGYRKKRYREWFTGWMFVLPCAAVLLLMALYPMIQVLIFSFSDVRIVGFETEFAGFDNFNRVFSDPQLMTILWQTIVWTVASLALRILLGFTAALLIDSRIRGQRAFRVVALVPWVVPSIVAANTWRWVYNPDFGIINTFVRNFNPEFGVVWFSDFTMASVIVSFVWTGFPFIMLMVLAGLQGIPSDYKEAARVDGASSAQVFWRIILPNLKPIIMIIVVLELITGFNAFDLIFVMTGGGPGIQSTILGILIYNLAFLRFDFGAASAASVLLLSIMVLFFLVYVPVSAVGRRRKEREGAQ